MSLNWLRNFVKNTTQLEYKHLLIPKIIIRIKPTGYVTIPILLNRYSTWKVEYEINGHTVLGHTYIFPTAHGQQLTEDKIKYAFQVKFTRQLNAIQKGNSKLPAQQMKHLVDRIYGVNCKII